MSIDIQNIKKVFFIGIGGIGMSAIARYFNEKGMEVSGYDKTETPLTQQLKAEGINVIYEDSESMLMSDADLVVFTPAIPKSNVIYNWYLNNNAQLYKRSDVLGMITADMDTIAVAGTHGKTTTSTMIAHIFRHSGVGCNAFLGGIAVNYQSNYWSNPHSNVAVVEADEYDRSFLKLNPQTAVLTAIDADHLDIYGSEEECQNAFIAFTQRIKSNGTLVHKKELKRISEMGGDKISYSLQNDLADAYATSIQMKDGGYKMNIVSSEWMLNDIYLPLGGMHNVENCVAAVTVAKKYFLEDNDIRNAIAAFKGIKRRFEYVYKSKNTVYIDDYAHHPEELKSLIKSAMTLFSKKKCVIAFQPHLFTRTRDFASGFADALSLADEVILLDIYPAREEPIEGVSSQMIAERMGNPNVTVLNKESLLSYVQNAPLELFITAGAGDIDALVPEIKKILEARNL